MSLLLHLVYTTRDVDVRRTYGHKDNSTEADSDDNGYSAESVDERVE